MRSKLAQRILDETPKKTKQKAKDYGNILKQKKMKQLNDNGGVFLDKQDYFDKNDLLNILRLQKQLLIEENILATIEDCINIWQHYSSDLSASWLFFPDKDEDILKQIRSSDFFDDFENYCL